jgi:predicted HNH restriction endonuclease
MTRGHLPPQKTSSVLKVIRDGQPQKKLELWLGLLRTQYRMPNHTITARQLADQLGLASYSESNLRYGALAHAIANVLQYVPPRRTTGDKEPIWLFTISIWEDGGEDEGEFEFTMRPELADALEQMRWV